MLHVKDGGTLSQGWRHCQQHCEMFLKGTLCAGVRRTVGRKRRKSPPWASPLAFGTDDSDPSVGGAHPTSNAPGFAWRHHALCYSPRPTDNGSLTIDRCASSLTSPHAPPRAGGRVVCPRRTSGQAPEYLRDRGAKRIRSLYLPSPTESLPSSPPQPRCKVRPHLTMDR